METKYDIQIDTDGRPETQCKKQNVSSKKIRRNYPNSPKLPL